LLAGHDGALARAGLKRVTCSAATLLQHGFAEMPRRDALERVMDGLRAAETAGLQPVKLNCVVVRGTNDDEVVDFARFSRETGYEVRFIEFMPLDADEAWTRAAVVPSREVLARIDAVYPLEPEQNGPEPATMWRLRDSARGARGVIASVTEPVCTCCNP